MNEPNKKRIPTGGQPCITDQPNLLWWSYSSSSIVDESIEPSGNQTQLEYDRLQWVNDLRPLQIFQRTVRLACWKPRIPISMVGYCPTRSSIISPYWAPFCHYQLMDLGHPTFALASLPGSTTRAGSSHEKLSRPVCYPLNLSSFSSNYRNGGLSIACVFIHPTEGYSHYNSFNRPRSCS